MATFFILFNIARAEAPILTYVDRMENYAKTNGKSFNKDIANMVYDKLPEAIREELMPVILCESGFNPEARNVNKSGTIDKGLFQFNSRWIPEGYAAESIDRQIEVATKIYESNGLADWKWSKPCWSTAKNTV